MGGKGWIVAAGIWVLLCGVLFLRALFGFKLGTNSASYVFATVAELGLWGTLGLVGLIVCLFQWRAVRDRARLTASHTASR